GPGPLRARVARRKPRQRLDRSSFTALARGAFEASAAGLADGQDHDRLIDADLGPGAGASAGAALDPTAEAAERVPLADLVAGTRLGTGMHLLLERIDFRGDPIGWRQQAEQLARRRALPAEAVEPLLGSLNTLVQTPLGHGALDFRLADLSRRDRIDEMGYVLPVALEAAAGRFVPPGAAGGAPRDRRTAPGSAAFPRVGPADLARVLAAHPGGGLPEDYPRQLERLPAQAIAGWLRGSLDLVFRRPGPQGAACWYLIDWKSNRLGRHWSDYAPERLAQAMAQHHYFLQAHLYTLALHRHLARHAGYDYATGFGGFLYVFVRGMHPDRPGSGVLFDRPPLARIEALDALLREGRR
ncbi:MAG: hypothetical protein KDH92_08635, partial [Chloroflexi bacterium]|nr:hypothetical protein [Chloroflexota bacterium]